MKQWNSVFKEIGSIVFVVFHKDWHVYVNFFFAHVCANLNAEEEFRESAIPYLEMQGKAKWWWRG